MVLAYHLFIPLDGKNKKCCEAFSPALELWRRNGASQCIKITLLGGRDKLDLLCIRVSTSALLNHPGEQCEECSLEKLCHSR